MLLASKALARSIVSHKLIIPQTRSGALRSCFSTQLKDYQHILTSRFESKDPEKPTSLGVGLIELNQPKSLNSLSDALFEDLIDAARVFDQQEDIGSIVITGKGKAFAAGADIPEMSTKSFAEAYNSNMFAQWADVCKISKPIIAAVNGFALGGGCELAMMCDIVIASPNAKFGQPEVNLGIIPGTFVYI